MFDSQSPKGPKLIIIFVIMQKLELKDLFSAVPPQDPTQTAEVKASSATQQFLTAPSQQIQSLPLKQQLKIKRESTYRHTQQEADKWIGIVKLNREKDTLNLVRKDRDDAARVNFFPSAPVSQLQNKVEGKLQEMCLVSQQSVMKQEETVLSKLSKEEAQERLKEARKLRTAQFNEEAKRRRMAKIKSKLYRKIKKRQKVREEARKVGELQGEERRDYLDKLSKQRIKERITLRHRSKSQHIQNLLRFSKNNKQGIQDTLNEVNAIRQQQLEKANQEFRQNMSDELDEENYQEQLQEFQKEIDQMENEEGKPQGLDAMKFMQVGKQKELQREREELREIAAMVAEQAEQAEEEKEEMTRKVLGETPAKGKTAATGQSFIQRNLKQALGGHPELTEGIDLNKLKAKYQPQRSQLNLTDAIELRQGTIDHEVVEQNFRDFQRQKLAEQEAELPKEKGALKGWGSWAGPGISEPKVDQAAEVRKKLAKIEEIKKKRRDGEMAGVIIRQTYNKNLKDYFVSKLPHNMKSAEQFDYLQQEVVGPEWNTQTQFTSNIQPKVMTKAGQVIEPVKLPKQLVRSKK